MSITATFNEKVLLPCNLSRQNLTTDRPKNAHASAILPTFTWRHRGKVGQRPASHSQPTVLIMVSLECILYQPLTSSLLQFFYLCLISSHKMQLLTMATVKLLQQRAPPFSPWGSPDHLGSRHDQDERQPQRDPPARSCFYLTGG